MTTSILFDYIKHDGVSIIHAFWLNSDSPGNEYAQIDNGEALTNNRFPFALQINDAVYDKSDDQGSMQFDKMSGQGHSSAILLKCSANSPVYLASQYLNLGILMSTGKHITFHQREGKPLPTAGRLYIRILRKGDIFFQQVYCIYDAAYPIMEAYNHGVGVNKDGMLRTSRAADGFIYCYECQHFRPHTDFDGHACSQCSGYKCNACHGGTSHCCEACHKTRLCNDCIGVGRCCGAPPENSDTPPKKCAWCKKNALPNQSLCSQCKKKRKHRQIAQKAAQQVMLSEQILRHDPYVIHFYRKTYDSALLHVEHPNSNRHWILALSNAEVKRRYNGQLMTLQDVADFLNAIKNGAYYVQFQQCSKTLLALMFKPHAVFASVVMRALTQELWINVERTTPEMVNAWKVKRE